MSKIKIFTYGNFVITDLYHFPFFFFFAYIFFENSGQKKQAKSFPSEICITPVDNYRRIFQSVYESQRDKLITHFHVKPTLCG